MNIVVEPNLTFRDIFKPSIDEMALKRKALKYMPITQKKLYLSFSGLKENDETILSYLSSDFKQDKNIKDINLSDRFLSFLKFLKMNQMEFDTACTNPGEKAL